MVEWLSNHHERTGNIPQPSLTGRIGENNAQTGESI
jgi:hypothetical protein